MGRFLQKWYVPKAKEGPNQVQQFWTQTQNIKYNYIVFLPREKTIVTQSRPVFVGALQQQRDSSLRPNRICIGEGNFLAVIFIRLSL